LPGDKGVAEIWVAPVTTETKRKLQIQYIYPLQTTEYPGVVPVEDAQEILDVPGTMVVVIGPDFSGSLQHVGKRGHVMEGGVSLPGSSVAVQFHVTSLCRSEPRPMIKS
jgi:hypothetical protein